MASSASALPWLWVIEALAGFKEVDASVLKEFVKKVPEISGDLGENAREMVNFRVLDTLTSQQVGRNGDGSLAPVSEKRFDPSDRCEDVVWHMLCERKNDVEMFKPQVQNFVMQKRAVLPKCSLQKLKDAILEGKHPTFASLKAKSGLSTSSHSKDRGDTNEATCSDGKIVVERGNLTSSNMENLNGFSQENCRNRTLTPLKRDLCHLESKDQALSSNNNSPNLERGGDIDLPITKKPKHVSFRTAPGYESQETLVDGQDLDLRVNEAKEGENCGVDVASPNKARENTCVETINVVEKSLPTPSNNFPHDAQRTTDHIPGQECSGDSDGYQEESVHIAVRKCDFLSSQSTFTQDSLATDDCTALNICVKCEKAGDLLVCSAKDCPIMVHQSCMGVAPSFDNSENFICPFCSYSHSIADYLKIKKKASLVRKDLAVFIGLENGHRPNKNAEKTIRPEQNQQRQDDNVNKNGQVSKIAMKSIRLEQNQQRQNDNANKNDQVCKIAKKSIRPEQNRGVEDNSGNRNDQTLRKRGNEISNCKNKEKINDNPQGEPSTSRVNDNPPLRVDGALVDNETVFSAKEGNREGGKIGPECQSNMPLERQEIEAHASSPCREREFVPMTDKHASELDSLVPNGAVAESSDDEDGQPASGYVMKPRKQEKRYISPATIQLRRKKVPWTSEEEEILKEGVKKFTGDQSKWKKILEFGSPVFLKGRTAVDLKDKWRNICKKESMNAA